MASNEKDIADALRLEEIEFMEFAQRATVEAQTAVNAMEADMAARGLHLSGPRYTRDLEIRFGRMNAIIENAIAKRSQLGQRLPELLTAARLNDLKLQLDRSINTLVQSQYDERARNHGYPGGVLQALNRMAEQKAGQLRGKVAHAIEKLVLEARLGLKEEQPMTFNISNSTITNLNLGTVVGDLTASVQVLNQHGQKSLARDIQALTEALASADVPAEPRRELLEHLSVVSTEVALPPEKRKMAPLRSSIEALQKGVTIAGQLGALWQPIEHILEATGVLQS